MNTANPKSKTWVIVAWVFLLFASTLQKIIFHEIFGYHVSGDLGAIKVAQLSSYKDRLNNPALSFLSAVLLVAALNAFSEEMTYIASFSLCLKVRPERISLFG